MNESGETALVGSTTTVGRSFAASSPHFFFGAGAAPSRPTALGGRLT